MKAKKGPRQGMKPPYARGFFAEPPRKRIAPGEKVVLELTERERALIVEESFADDELTNRLRLVPIPGQPARVGYTLGELDALLGAQTDEEENTDS